MAASELGMEVETARELQVTHPRQVGSIVEGEVALIKFPQRRVQRGVLVVAVVLGMPERTKPRSEVPGVFMEGKAQRHKILQVREALVEVVAQWVEPVLCMTVLR
jgi:hypothetical protein